MKCPEDGATLQPKKVRGSKRTRFVCPYCKYRIMKESRKDQLIRMGRYDATAGILHPTVEGTVKSQ